jgi:monomeric isocitrate dehydrogenase
VNRCAGATTGGRTSPGFAAASLGELVAPSRASYDAELAERFRPLAERLAAEGDAITRELGEVQGRTVDIGGYYHPDIGQMAEVMRPSATLNAALKEFDVEPVASGDM